jgi:hypothetical protein
VLEEVKLGFLIVGHTHEDIEKSFGYLSKILKEYNKYILTNLMQTFMISQGRPFISKLIKESFNFKLWVQRYFKEGFETLVGHIDMHFFCFFGGF